MTEVSSDGLTDDQLTEEAKAMVIAADQLEEVKSDYSRAWGIIEGELKRRSQSRFYFRMADGKRRVVGYDTYHMKGSIDIPKLVEQLTHEEWVLISKPGPRELDQEKLAKAIAAGKIKDKVVQKCVTAGTVGTRRMGPKVVKEEAA
jgi:hypothetical protein